MNAPLGQISVGVYRPNSPGEKTVILPLLADRYVVIYMIFTLFELFILDGDNFVTHFRGDEGLWGLVLLSAISD